MKYAFVEIPSQNNEQIIVKTSSIQNIDKYNSINKHKSFYLELEETVVKCLILKVADSMEELNNRSSRLRYPKYNKSSFDSSSEEDESSLSVVVKKKRKMDALNKVAVKKEKNAEILKAYKAINDTEKETVDENEKKTNLNVRNTEKESTDKSHENESNGEEMNASDRNKICSLNGNSNDGSGEDFEEMIPLAVKVPKNSHKLIRNSSECETVEPSVSQSTQLSSKAPKIINNEEVNDDMQKKLIEKLLKENKQQKEEIQKLTRYVQNNKLDDLTNVNIQHQQQQRRQQLQQQILHQQHQPWYEEKENEQTDEENVQFPDMVPIGDDLFIPSLAHTDAFNTYSPSKFINIMSHAMWGYETLAKRVVSSNKNIRDRKVLTPKKKVVLIHQYKKFLKKRNISNDILGYEMRNINTYLGRSITSAKKKVLAKSN